MQAGEDRHTLLLGWVDGMLEGFWVQWRRDEERRGENQEPTVNLVTEDSICSHKQTEPPKQITIKRTYLRRWRTGWIRARLFRDDCNGLRTRFSACCSDWRQRIFQSRTTSKAVSIAIALTSFEGMELGEELGMDEGCVWKWNRWINESRVRIGGI